ncbi:MAG: autotransporter assembly complex protein TamA [Pararhodobacter sp.]
MGGVPIWSRHVASAVALGLALTIPAPHPAGAMDELRFNAPGAPDDLLRSLQAGSLLASAEREGQPDPLDTMAAARAEYGRLIGLLYEHGYFAPRISIRLDGREAAQISALTPPRRVGLVEVDVELGPQFRFGRAEVLPLAPGTTLPEGFVTDGVARSTLVRDAATAAVDGWRAQGHALAEPADQQIVARHGEQRLDVHLRVAPGPRLRFGALIPSGNQATRSERIVAIAGLDEGEIYDPEAIARAESRLRRTGTFASVALRDADTPNPDGTLDIEALVEEAPPRRLGFGAELDSQAGLRLTGFWLHRNLLGGAERLRLEAAIDGIAARVGGLGFTLDARYTRPATFNRDTDLELGLRAVRMDERDFGADAVQAEARLVHRFSDRLTGSAGLVLRIERARFGAARGLRADFGTLALPVGLSFDSRDRPLDATRGLFIAGEAMPYYGFLAASSGLRIKLDGRAYTDMGSEGRFVLAGRAQLGAIWGSALDATPRDYLFYSGGGGTVRGLPFQSLGVTGPGGVASGGQGFAALSGELRARVSDTIALAGFVDAGYVSAGPFSGASDWQLGGGVGLRYQTPIGPMRLDLAVPLRRNATAAGASRFQIYLGIGQAF